MGDMLDTVIPKSDQLNADDLIGGRSMTITITKAKVDKGNEQPASLNFEGDNGKPYKPCKSMRRVMIEIWGKDSANYVGKSMTIYCDPKVVFGGKEVGGIRISHMSHMDAPRTLALTATKANRKPFTVKPLVIEEDGKVPDDLYEKCRLALLGATSMAELTTAWDDAQKAAKEHRDSNAMRGFIVLKDKMKQTIQQTAPQENE